MDTENTLPHSSSLSPSAPTEDVASVHADDFDVEQLKAAVVKELQVRINAWIDDPEGNCRNYSAFARKSMVTDSTIRRIFNNNSIPVQNSLMRILTRLINAKNVGEVVEYFKKRNSPIYIYFKRFTSFVVGIDANAVVEGINFPEIPDDEDTYLVYGVINVYAEISYFELVRLLGEGIADTVDRLIKVGLVIQEGGQLKTSSVQVYFTKKAGLGISKALIQKFSRPEREESRIILFTDKVSEDGFAKILELREEFERKTDEVLLNNPGKIPIFLSCLLDHPRVVSSSPSIFGGSND